MRKEREREKRRLESDLGKEGEESWRMALLGSRELQYTRSLKYAYDHIIIENKPSIIDILGLLYLYCLIVYPPSFDRALCEGNFAPRKFSSIVLFR